MKHFLPVASVCLAMSVCTVAICNDIKALRGLPVEKEHERSTLSDTGAQYWLELKHNGETQRCTNRSIFYNGDRFRIHLKSNVAAYAYILLLLGSRGEKSVLFPSASLGNNKTKAGQWVTLPVGKDGEEKWFTFDEYPGTEVVRIVISPENINPAALLSGETTADARSDLATSTLEGSNDDSAIDIALDHQGK